MHAELTDSSSGLISDKVTGKGRLEMHFISFIREGLLLGITLKKVD